MEKILLDLSGKEDKIYEEIVKALDSYKNTEPFSTEFIVEGTIKNPIIIIKYPGKKVQKREVKRANSARWANLFDFMVVMYENGKEVTQIFTFENILKDFKENKKNSEEFWGAIEEIYYKNKLVTEPPILKGINSKLFLLALKWIWIQEDFNYKLRSGEVKSPTKYILLSRKGKPMSKGAGRAKFFAALILLKYGFGFEEVKKIIPMYA